MTESLKELVVKLKKRQNENSQTSEISDPSVPQETEVNVPQETEGLDEVEEEIAPVKEVKKAPVSDPKAPEKDDNAQRVQMEIEMLQNDGRYRVELLHQMQELNKALVVIAGVLVDLSGNGK